MRTRPRQISAVLTATLLVLGGCGSETSNEQSAAVAAFENGADSPSSVTLPPMLTASRTYRCKDNSLVYIDFFNDDVTAQLRTEKDGKVTILAASEPKKPYVAEGYSLAGNGTTVQLARPGKPVMSCKA